MLHNLARIHTVRNTTEAGASLERVNKTQISDQLLLFRKTVIRMKMKNLREHEAATEEMSQTLILLLSLCHHLAVAVGTDSKRPIWAQRCEDYSSWGLSRGYMKIQEENIMINCSPK